MIFQHTLEQVLSGQKTQTRRIIKPGDVAVRSGQDEITAVKTNGRTKWAVGKTYSVQPGRGKPAVARIQITRIRRETVSQISEADAIADGFTSRQAFLNTWRHIHGDDSLDLDVWVVHFELE